jgi:thiol-disulfide isomerase/thioredoxin
MDRLSVVSRLGWIVVLLGLAACPADDKASARYTRYQAVKATPGSQAPSKKWCDVELAPGAARLVLPPATSVRGPARGLESGRPVWLNLWATWCKPCLREMPLLLGWRDRLKQDGVSLDLWFLSVDEEADDLAKFLAAHPDIAPAPSLRISSPKDFQTWASRYRIDASSSIPIHVLAGSDGSVRCVRLGSLDEGDYATVAALLR